MYKFRRTQLVKPPVPFCTVQSENTVYIPAQYWSVVKPKLQLLQYHCSQYLVKFAILISQNSGMESLILFLFSTTLSSSLKQTTQSDRFNLDAFDCRNPTKVVSFLTRDWCSPTNRSDTLLGTFFSIFDRSGLIILSQEGIKLGLRTFNFESSVQGKRPDFLNYIVTVFFVPPNILKTAKSPYERAIVSHEFITQ